MSGSEVVVGVPAACLLPAARYGFKEVVEPTAINLPIRGSFPEEFPVQGEFDICPEPGVILMTKITEALFAFGKYPKLEYSQRFVISTIMVEDDDTITVIGRVVEFVEETSIETI